MVLSMTLLWIRIEKEYIGKNVLCQLVVKKTVIVKL